MAFIISTDLRPVKVQAFGNWFEFKPGQIKNMQQNLADFLSQDRRQLGFVALPEEFEDPNYKNTEEGKKILDDANETGRRQVVAELNYRKRNLEVSLQRDLDLKGEKVNALVYASDSDKDMYRRLAEYTRMSQDKSADELEEIRKLKEEIDGASNVSNIK